VPPFLPTSELPDKQWQKSLFLTIAVHVCFLLFGMFAPRFLHFQQKIPEVYTVNLFSATDLGGPPPAASSKATAPQAEPAPPKAAPEPAKPTPPEKTQPVPEPPAVAKDAVSLKPIKTKEKADIDKVKMLRDKLLAENTEKQAKEAAEKARADADKKAKGAVDSLKQALAAGQQAAAGRASVAGTQAGSGTGNGAGGGVTVDENLRRYLIAVNSQIQEHWVLPDLQNWKENVEAIVIIRVRRDGAVIETTFKKKSDNVFFNQFVEKTLKLSAPLPPFPIGINQSEMEIGLKFRPGEVF
jgi:outer membrane biosynthesis protein TonB